MNMWSYWGIPMYCNIFAFRKKVESILGFVILFKKFSWKKFLMLVVIRGQNFKDFYKK